MHRLRRIRRFCYNVKGSPVVPQRTLLKRPKIRSRPENVPYASGRRRGIQTAARPASSSHEELTTLGKRQNIDIDSLTATLQAHRHRNETQITSINPENGHPSLDALASAVTDDETSPVRRYRYGDASRFGFNMWDPIVQPSYEKHPNIDKKYALRTPFNRSFTKETKELEPWLKYIEEEGKTGPARLDAELRAFEKMVTLDADESLAVNFVVQDVQHSLRKDFLAKEIVPMGSIYHDLSTPLSDIDLYIHRRTSDHKLSCSPLLMYPIWSSNKKGAIRRALNQVNSAFTLHESLDKRPGHRAIHNESGMIVDIQAFPPVPAHDAKLNEFISRFPGSRAITLTLRFALEMRGKFYRDKGYPGSYDLMLMVLTALAHQSDGVYSQDFGGQLMNVLEFWGYADTKNYMFTLEPAMVHRKIKNSESTQKQREIMWDKKVASQMDLIETLRKQDPRKEKLLCLQDPIERDRDVGETLMKIEQLQHFFRTMHRLITHRMDPKGPAARPNSILGALVAGNYLIMEGKREQLREFARERTKRQALLKAGGLQEDTHGDGSLVVDGRNRATIYHLELNDLI